MNSPPESSTTEEPLRKARFRWLPSRRWALIALVLGSPLLFIFLSVGVVALRFALENWEGQAAVDDEIARIQAAGEPITVEDLYAYHRLPPSTLDATASWTAALESFDEGQLKEGQHLPFVGDGDETLMRPEVADSSAADVKQFLAAFESRLASAHAAAKSSGQCRFPVKFEDGQYALYQHAHNALTLSRLLKLEVRQRLYEGDISGALESLETLLALGNSMEHQLSLLEHLVRGSTFGKAVEEGECILNEVQLSDTQLADLQESFQSLELHASFTRATIGDRAMGYLAVQHPETIDDFDPAVLFMLRLAIPPASKIYLGAMSEKVAASRQAYPEALTRSTQIDDQLLERSKEGNAFERLKYASPLMLASLSKSAFASNAHRIAARDITVAAIASERHRLEKGDYPESLPLLVPEYLEAVPSDPFDGQPLRFKKSQQEVVLYSVGINGVNDLGDATKDEKGVKRDIVLRINAAKVQSVTQLPALQERP